MNTRAQTTKDKGYISFLIGPSFPLGDYAKKDVTNSSSGVAVTGETIKFSYASLIGKHLGVTASIHGQRNPIDVKSFETASLNSGYSDWKFDKTSWLFGSLLLGGYGQFVKSGSDFSFTTKAMIGVIYVTSPKLNGNSSSSTAIAHSEQSSKSAFGLSYLLGGEVKYNLTKRICLLSDFEYLGTPKIKFENIKSTFSVVHYSNGTPTSFEQYSVVVDSKQKISSINLIFGVGLRL